LLIILRYRISDKLVLTSEQCLLALSAGRIQMQCVAIQFKRIGFISPDCFSGLHT